MLGALCEAKSAIRSGVGRLFPISPVLILVGIAGNLDRDCIVVVVMHVSVCAPCFRFSLIIKNNHLVD